MNDIELIISEGIKKGKWIDISYKNSNNEITYYWIAINDINLKSKNLNVSIFNDNKSLNVLNATIRFENILSAKILEFTTYETPKELIKKIEKNRDEAKWLKYESFNNNILRYYLKCSELDNDPYQTDSFLMAGIDKDVLLKSKKIILDDNQERVLLRYLKQKEKDKTSGQMYYFILSFLSIEDNGKIMGARQTMLSIGNVVGPLIGSAIYSKGNPFVFIISGFIILLSFAIYVMYFLIARKKQIKSDEN